MAGRGVWGYADKLSLPSGFLALTTPATGTRLARARVCGRGDFHVSFILRFPPNCSSDKGVAVTVV